jgi:hypothetical protein
MWEPQPLATIRATTACHGDSFNFLSRRKRSRDSSLGIAMGHSLDGRGSLPGKGNLFSSCPKCPDRLFGPPSLLANEYPGLFLQGTSFSAAVENSGDILPFPIPFHGMVLNYFIFYWGNVKYTFSIFMFVQF